MGALALRFGRLVGTFGCHVLDSRGEGKSLPLERYSPGASNRRLRWGPTTAGPGNPAQSDANFTLERRGNHPSRADNAPSARSFPVAHWFSTANPELSTAPPPVIHRLPTAKKKAPARDPAAIMLVGVHCLAKP
jgi:hypothetical protein